MLSEQASSQTQAHKPHQKYQRFISDIYSCIKQKEHLMKRCSTPDSHANFPKLLTYEKPSLLSTIDEVQVEGRSKPGVGNVKSIKFRSFLNALDEHQRKISLDNMNLLGLEVKKISYAEKVVKKPSQKQLALFFDENIYVTSREERSSGKKNDQKKSGHENSEYVTCSKVGLTFREGMHSAKASKVPVRNSITRSRQRSSLSVRSQQKRRTSNQAQNPIYDNRINSYRQLIFKVNFAHGVYAETERDLHEDYSLKNEMKYKAWVGGGNNGNLIKSLLKRRFWWVVVQEKSINVNFMWTQLKVSQFIDKQQPSPIWAKDTTKVWGKTNTKASSDTFRTVKKAIQSKNTETTEDDHLHKILTEDEIKKYKQYSRRLSSRPTYAQRRDILQLQQTVAHQSKMHNHLVNNFYLGNKKALFYNLKQYYQLLGENPFTRIPLTFHIKKGTNDVQYKRFVAYYKRRQVTIKKQEQEERGKGKKMRNVWIVKPGELTNRGNGITVIDQVYELNQIIRQESLHENGSQKTFIVQLYIDRPMLYQRRKFDIRHYMLVTHLHGLMRAYWFREGYIRTTSYQFDIHNFEREIHLTNDAVQKCTPLYGKYEPGNKLSYAEFQRYLDSNYPKNGYNFQEQILPQMKAICLDSVKSSYLKLSPQRLQHSFQLFGLDFMIDQNFKPWLIEINTNPCLQLSSPLLARLIPQAMEQALRLSLDAVYPPPCHYPNTYKHLAPEASLESLSYELIFDEKRDGEQVRDLYSRNSGDLLEQIGDISDDEVYQDDGKDLAADQLL